MTGLAHRVTKDDIHDGYFIPKGSLVIPNIWLVHPFSAFHILTECNDRFMLNDPQTYANPVQFNPERFLSNDGKRPETDPRRICFGFGRR
jgi:cytochrome P450